MATSRKRPLDGIPLDGTVTIQLLYTNDTHSAMEPFLASNGSEAGSEVGGVAGRAALFTAMRAECPETLTLDAGDVLVGTPYFEFLQGEADLKVLQQLDCASGSRKPKGYSYRDRSSASGDGFESCTLQMML